MADEGFQQTFVEHPRAEEIADGKRGFAVNICSECGRVEGERPQAGCCPNCGIGSAPILCWAIVNHRISNVEREELGL